MTKLTVEIPDGQLGLLDKLVTEKLYNSRDEAVQNAIRDLLAYHGKI